METTEIINGSDEVKFEEAMSRLEQIVSDLERGKCDLDESLGLFEEGVKLVKLCSAKLENAAQKVKILTAEGKESDDEGEEND